MFSYGNCYILANLGKYINGARVCSSNGNIKLVIGIPGKLKRKDYKTLKILIKQKYDISDDIKVSNPNVARHGATNYYYYDVFIYFEKEEDKNRFIMENF